MGVLFHPTRADAKGREGELLLDVDVEGLDPARLARRQGRRILARAARPRELRNGHGLDLEAHNARALELRRVAVVPQFAGLWESLVVSRFGPSAWLKFLLAPRQERGLKYVETLDALLLRRVVKADER